MQINVHLYLLLLLLLLVKYILYTDAQVTSPFLSYRWPRHLVMFLLPLLLLLLWLFAISNSTLFITAKHNAAYNGTF